VPKDLKLAGEKEVFTITVDYDTQKLYGKIQATRDITIASNAPQTAE